MTPQAVSIGEAARQSRVKVPTIRYYEQIGLLANNMACAWRFASA